MARRRDQPPPSTGTSEKEVLTGFLAYLRESVLAKVDGVPEPEVRTPGVSSGTNLLGLLKHLTHVERYAFLGEEVSSWPSTFVATEEETVEAIVDGYRRAVADGDEVIAGYGDLAQPTPSGNRRKAPPSMRWALAHMIEETGRHAGHLDIIRERIDDSTGR